MIRVACVCSDPSVERIIRQILNDSNEVILNGVWTDLKTLNHDQSQLRHDVLLLNFENKNSEDIYQSLLHFYAFHRKPIVLIVSDSSEQTIAEKIHTDLPIIDVISLSVLQDVDKKSYLKESLKVSAFIGEDILSDFDKKVKQKSMRVASKSEEELNEFPLVLIGSSTGGPKVIFELFKELGQSVHHMSFVLAQHISHIFLLEMKNQLEKIAQVPVHILGDGMMLQKGQIYLAPVQRQYVLNYDYHFIPDPNRHLYPFMPNINVLFNSIAMLYKKQVINIILSGLGNDGTDSAGVIKKNGGTVIAQNPQTAELTSMPDTVIRRSFHHYIFTPTEIVKYLKNISIVSSIK